jgi:hypothetical protein
MSFEVGDYVKYKGDSNLYQIMDITYSASVNINDKRVYYVSQSDIIHEDGTDKPFKIGDRVFYIKQEPIPPLLYIKSIFDYYLRGVYTSFVRTAYSGSNIEHAIINKEEKSAKFLAFGNGNFEVGDYVHFKNQNIKGLYQIISINDNEFRLRNFDNSTIISVPKSFITHALIHAIIHPGEKTAQFRAIGKKKKRSKNK